MTSYEKYSLLVTGLGLVVGLSVLIVYGLQLKAMRGQLAEMKSGSDTATKAANAAIKSADVAEQTLRISQRAYVAVDNFVIHDLAAGGHPYITFKIFNVGRTSATITEAITKVGVYEFLAPEPEYTGGPVGHPAVIGQGKDVNVGTGRMDLVGNTLNDILRGTHKLYLYGRIVYRDVFGITHHLGFGLYYDPAARLFSILDNANYNYED